MAPVDQTIFVHDPQRPGNCFAACIATVLDLELHQVPHFIEYGITFGDAKDPHTASSGSHWWAMFLGFMAGRGLWVLELDSEVDAAPGELVLVAGMSPRGVVHQVIYRDGQLWHDPHPSRAGVLDIREVLTVRSIDETGFDHQPTDVCPWHPASPESRDRTPTPKETR
jgi:hypothetical protein